MTAPPAPPLSDKAIVKMTRRVICHDQLDQDETLALIDAVEQARADLRASRAEVTRLVQELEACRSQK